MAMRWEIVEIGGRLRKVAIAEGAKGTWIAWPGGVRFFERREVKDVLAYLRLLVNPADAVSLRRIINVPPRRIGKTSVEKAVAKAASAGRPLLEYVLDGTPGLSAGVSAKMKQFADLYRRLSQEFRYRSLRVLEQRLLRLHLQEVGGLALPTGKRVRIRPLHVGKGGVLIAVEIEGTLQTDVRVPNRNQVVIGAERYRDGKLIVTLRPDY